MVWAFPDCGPLTEDSATELKGCLLNVCTVYGVQGDEGGIRDGEVKLEKHVGSQCHIFINLLPNGPRSSRTKGFQRDTKHKRA